MNRLAKVAVVILSAVVFSYVGLGYVLGKTDDDKTYRSLSVYGEVMQRVQEDYVDQPNLSMVTAGSLHGLLESLDPYSGYMSPREYSDYKEKEKNAAHGEIGATLSKRFGYIIIVSVLPDGPADKLGLHSGDILEAIAGFTTRDMSVGQADALLTGAPGTTVKADVVRRGSTEPQPMDLPRAVISTPHLMTSKISDDVAYVRVPALDPGEAAELRDKLQQMDHQGLHKLVLDLRDCARGPVSEGVAAAQLFVNSGTIATLSGQTVTKQQFVATPDKVAWHGPVEVLISSSTSGAAEVVAAAIGDNKRGDLVGENTFGAASEQKLIPMEDGAALVLTVAYYYTPANKPIIDQGVPPTVEVAAVVPDTDEDAEQAPAAPATHEVPPRPGAKTVTPSSNQAPSTDDPVIHKALDLLNGQAQKAS